jgi:rubrerythrin
MPRSALQSPGMTPKAFAPVWKCRHCKYQWLIVNENKEPERCPNRNCRAVDWNRKPKKAGRPKGTKKKKGNHGKN